MATRRRPKKAPVRRKTAARTRPSSASPASAVLDTEKDFSMLSLRDLVAARDAYHLHLMEKQHVVATAVGRYLIRSDERWPQFLGDAAEHDKEAARQPKKQPRTLYNSEVRPYSWPCVLVFVDRWMDLEDVQAGRVDPSQLVPRSLDMPDGSRVPVCVVYAQPVDAPAYAPVSPRFPGQFIGGGYPIIARVQEEDHVASVGCMVTDGHDVYALTNRHVAGRPGEELFSKIGGEPVRVGVSSDKQLTRKKFSEVYPDFPDRHMYVNLDVGLIRVDDLTRWTAQVYGIGQMGNLADLSADNISLRLIDAHVRAFGAASGQMHGVVKALFYRYKSIGGMEYCSDFLIGPRHGTVLPTRPGDSGTVWMLEDGKKNPPRPLALQWGGHAFVARDGGKSMAPYALATCLATVCSQLEVDVVRDWNVGILDYWGAVGHYTIAALAIDRIDGTKYPKLKKLMQANLTRITYAAGTITAKSTSGLSTNDFVALADVPDLVWKKGHSPTNPPPNADLAWKRAHSNRGPAEHPNHFADMDAPRAAGDLLQLCSKDIAKNTDVDVWRKYYTDVKDKSRGLLPFRVQQFYEGMVADLKKAQPDFARFVCAAGIVSHYVGDACQPLHVSSWFNGDPTHMVPNPKAGQAGQPATIAQGTGVHSAYEDDMVNFHIDEITPAVQKDKAPLPANFKGGKRAAIATTQLILDTFAQIKPKDIVAEYVTLQQQGTTGKAAADALWEHFGAETEAVIAAGVRTLACVWQSAWAEAAAEAKAPASPSAFAEADLEAFFVETETFYPSKTIDHICDVIDC
jgi:hypothetical protein